MPTSHSPASLSSLLLFLLGLTASCSSAPRSALLNSKPTSPLQEPAGPAEVEGWSKLQAVAHAARYNDPDAWLLERLADDATRLNPLPDDLSVLPFPHVAFPAPDYDLAGRRCHGLSVGPLALAERTVGSFAAVNRPLDESTLGPDENLWEVIVSDPVFVVVAVGPGDLNNSKQWAISRSHPHYIFQGTFAGAAGEIDWMAVQMADGTEIAVVNGRVFDLAQGNLVLVRQNADGSLRLHQDLERLEAGTAPALRAAVVERLQAPGHATFLALE